MITPYERFMALAGRVLDGESGPSEREEFCALLREHPELIDVYRQLVDIDTLARLRFKHDAGIETEDEAELRGAGAATGYGARRTSGDATAYGTMRTSSFAIRQAHGRRYPASLATPWQAG